MKWVPSLPGLALAAVLVAPSPAAADVTHSQITAPSADPTGVFIDLNARTQGLDVRGTSDGNASDSVDVLCYYVDEDGIEADDLRDDVPVDASGGFAFSATGSEVAGLKGDNCTLRAVPSGSDPDNVAPFAGPHLLVGGIQKSTLQTGPNAGAQYDYDVTWPEQAGMFEVDSIGSCGVSDSAPIPDGTTRGGDVFYCAAYLWPSDGVRDEVLVDGHPAYTPYGALSAWAVGNSGSSDLPGIPQVQVDAGVDPATQVLTIKETSSLVLCSPAPDTYPASPGTCSSFVPSGVVLHRTLVEDHQGRVATITDDWSSSNGAAHQIDLEYEEDFAASTSVFQLPWAANGFVGYTPGQQVAAPPGGDPVSIVEADASLPPTDPQYAAGALTFETPPASVTFVRGAQQSASGVLIGYRRTVPATGVLELVQALSQAGSVSGVQGLAQEEEKTLARPSVAITSPADGATLSTSEVMVSGTAHDASGIAGVSVNGHPAHVASGGAWSLSVPLDHGRNTITAVARDASGNTASTSINVTSTAAGSGGGGGGGGPPLPPPPPDPPAGLVGCQVPPKLHGQPLKVARRAILRWHCRPGKTVLVWSRTVFKGRVIGARPHSGTHLPAGAHVIIVVSRGKKPPVHHPHHAPARKTPPHR